MKRQVTDTQCPCGIGAAFADCCGRHIEAGVPAPSALALMRSRYSAHVREASAYLLATWHASTRPPEVRFDPPAPRWLGLQIRAVQATDAKHATVEFVARWRIGGRAQRLHETSRFVHEGGRWYYVDGDLHG